MRTRASGKNFLAVNAVAARVNLGPCLDYPPCHIGRWGRSGCAAPCCCAVPLMPDWVASHQWNKN